MQNNLRWTPSQLADPNAIEASVREVVDARVASEIAELKQAHQKVLADLQLKLQWLTILLSLAAALLILTIIYSAWLNIHASAAVQKIASEDVGLLAHSASAIPEQQGNNADVDAQARFIVVVIAADNDNLQAFDQLIQIAQQPNNPFAKMATLVVNSIVSSLSLGDIVQGNLNWERYGYKTEAVTLDDCKTLIHKYGNVDVKIGVIDFVWNSTHFSKYDKLNFLVDEIQNDTSIAGARHSISLIDSEAHLGLNLLFYRKYIDWWQQNKAKYEAEATTP